jgi:hypothetical protein
MQTSKKSATRCTSPLQYEPIPVQQHMPLREIPLWIFYHLRLLNWWLFLLMVLGFLGAGGLVWLQLHTGGSQGVSRAAELSRFVMEPGAGLLAGMLASSLLVGDPLLEVMMATRTGMDGVLTWRSLLSFFLLLLCSTTYLAWSRGLGISYARQQSSLFLLLVWLAPVLVMSMLGLFGSLATRNAALGMVIAAVPLAGSLLLYEKLLSIQATHPFFLSYTYSGGQDAPDWWTNRLALLGVALVFAMWNWWLLRREERLLGSLL